MASTIKLKNGSGAPLASALVQGEPAFDLTNKRLYTENASGTVIEVGTNPAAEITANGGIALPDNQKATFGASDDLQIYHDGSNSFITDVGTGNLNIRGHGFLNLQKYDGENFLTCASNGAVTLYYDNAAKLATTATGIDVTGTVTADGLDVTGSTLELTTSTYKGLKINHSDGSTDQVLYISPVADTVGSYIQNNASYSSSFNYTPEYTNSSGIEFDKDGDIYLRANSGLTVGTNFIPTNRLRVQPNGDISFYEDTGTTAKFFWDASAESLGIGTSSPSSVLTVDGNTTTFANSGLVLKRTGALTGSAGFILAGTSGSEALTVNVNATERARIDSSGNLLVGKTASNIATAGDELRATGEAVFTTDGYAPFYLNRLTSDGDIAKFFKNTVQVGSISVTGSTTAYNITSDERLKENIVDTTHTVDINDIKVRQYDWKSNGEHQRYGFIAQELEAVYPEAVFSPEDPEEMKAVDYSKLVPLLVKEIQDLKAEVAALKGA